MHVLFRISTMPQMPIDRDYHFLWKVIQTGGGENALTELLSGLLQDLSIRRSFLINVLGLDTPDDCLTAATIMSESNEATERGIPDIHVSSGADLFVLIENKLNAPFTDNQPHEYYAALRKWKSNHPNGIACLVIQAPAARIKYLEKESMERLIARFPEYHHGNTCMSNITVKFVPWEDTRDVFQLVKSNSPVVEYLLASFLQILPKEVANIPLPMTKEHTMILTDSKYLEATTALQDLLHVIRGLMGSRYKITPSNDASGFTYQGFSASLLEDSKVDLWIGTMARLAAKFNTSPLFVQLYGSALRNTKDVVDAGYFLIDEETIENLYGWQGPFVPLTLSADLDSTQQAERIIQQIEHIYSLAIST